MTQPPPQSPPSNPNFYPVFPWPMWTPPATPPGFRPPGGKGDDDDDSWEVRAFAEDTGSVAGTTWPPRSYTCTFCRREFRSAQALGGHMNVHRRDRARLQHQHQQLPPLTGHVVTPAEFFQNDAAGFCVVCQQLSNSCSNGVIVDAGLSVPEADKAIEYDEREDENDQDGAAEMEVEEVDLELRLGK